MIFGPFSLSLSLLPLSLTLSLSPSMPDARYRTDDEEEEDSGTLEAFFFCKLTNFWLCGRGDLHCNGESRLNFCARGCWPNQKKDRKRERERERELWSRDKRGCKEKRMQCTSVEKKKE